MRQLLLLGVLFLSGLNYAQVITTNPTFPTADGAVTIIFNAVGTDLEGYTGDVYAHTGVGIEDVGRWQHVIESWGNNETQPKLTRTATDVYELAIIPSINVFYGVLATEKVNELCFVFRSAEGSPQSTDLFVDVYQSELSVNLLKPDKELLILTNESIEIEAASSYADSLILYLDDERLLVTDQDLLTSTLVASGTGKHWIWVEAKDANNSVYDSVYYFIRDEPAVVDLPHGVHKGINYINDTTVTLVLNAPDKEFIYLIGDFNDWDISLTTASKKADKKTVSASTWLMNKTADDEYHWITVSGIEPLKEYAFQYFIEGDIRVADPYTEKVLDPWNDKYISAETYPGLKAYPVGKTTEPTSVFQTGQQAYEWQVTDFTMPDVKDMVIYEMHIRDFVATHSYKTVADTLDYLKNLGVNMLELMPINEFEGNSSWGYNPSFYFAPDKYYGPGVELKKLVDECHKRGMGVVIDLVLNHSYGQSPLVRMYFENGKPASNNPWYNVNSNFSNPDAQWGYDFNHESLYTQEFVDSVNSFWMNQYNVDGFRFDFTKGFSNTPYGTSDWGSAYDADRIRLLKRMADEIWARKSNAYISFEHLSDNTEEKELANYGINLWGNLNHNYNEGTMGYTESGKSDISGMSYVKRGWDAPHLVGYMESHDEERLMFKNLEYGNSAENYSTKNINTGLQRIELAVNFFLTIPGPKMIWQFGELGYDYSIDYNGRVGEKPIMWDYFDVPNRKRIYDVYSALAKLKTTEPTFSTDNFDLDVRNALKIIHLNHDDMNVVVIGNFDVVKQNIIPNFQNTGVWYELYSGESIDVIDTQIELELAPGEYRIYSTKQLETPEITASVKNGLSAKVNNCLNVYPIPVGSELFVENMNNFTHVSIINALGQQVYSANLVGQFKSIPVQNLNKGVYIITAIHNDGSLHTGRFIKN